MENKPEKTALQDDYSYRAVDAYNTRMYLLPALADPERRAALIAEHRARPLYEAAQPGKPAPWTAQSWPVCWIACALSPSRTNTSLSKHAPGRNIVLVFCLVSGARRLK